MILAAVVTLLILLIAYWWANQGVLSALMHLLCVVIAGAVAFAVWEPITVNWVLSGSSFDQFAWGTVLVGVFVVVLFVLRMIGDRVAPNDIRVPEWANYVFGGAAGLFAGILSVGILMIGWGYVQASSDLLGYHGFHRSQQNNGQVIGEQTGLPPTIVLKITEGFFGYLSQGAFSPMGEEATLASWQPAISDQAGSAVRDTFDEGRGNISIPPSAIKVVEFFDLPTMGEGGCYLVRFDAEQPAFDRRNMFTLTSAQARLIGDDASGPTVTFPSEFGQKNNANDKQYSPFAFNDVASIMSSPSGAQNATFYLAFPKRRLEGQKPKFFQIKGLRFALPEAEKLPTISSMAAFLQKRSEGHTLSESALAVKKVFDDGRDGATVVGSSHITADSTINPITVSVNNLQGTLAVDESNWLISGAGAFNKGAQIFTDPNLRIKGILEPKDTRVVRLNVTRSLSPVDIYNVDKIRALRKAAGEGAAVELVDKNFETYQPFGYIWERTVEGKVEIFLDLPPGGVWSLHAIPQAAEGDKLYLLYRLPTNARIMGVLFRDPAAPDKAKVAATADWVVPSRR